MLYSKTQLQSSEKLMNFYFSFKDVLADLADLANWPEKNQPDPQVLGFIRIVEMSLDRLVFTDYF